MTDPARIPERGRLAGIDFGTVRIGVAVCDPDRILASPLITYSRRDESADRQFFQGLVAEERLVGFVVGLPVHMSGDESEKSRAARQFGGWLSEVTKLPVWYQDERFTTSEADQLMASGGLKRRKADLRRDMLAAQAILTRFLEAREHRPPEPLHD
jgi:putative Holliday junction resolvase